MKRCRIVVAVATITCSLVLVSSVAAKEKDNPKSAKQVDSGSFSVMMSGVRVATETFSIQQGATGSKISSQFKSAEGEQVAEQSSELELTPSAEIRKYEWKATAPEKASATVLPNDAFLVESYTVGGDNKPSAQNFLLPASTSILDDYFFIQREVLAWKYLASACKNEKGNLNCPRQKVQFGALNPHARTSMSVTIEFSGKDKVTLGGAERELSKFVLSSEAGDWTFWLDDQLKLVRLRSETGTEIVRD
ncbi:MAG TPA: hypothetical protein VL156_10365 [Terriglobales bacterium]|nr:hypothetical protein [Terriglobales bacterium]